MNITENIRSIRKEKGLSQAEVARRLEMEPPSYFRLENRGNKLSLEQIESIAKALEVSVYDLLEWNEEKHNVTDSDLIIENHQLREKVSELTKWLEDKNQLERFQKKHVASLELWLCNYFRYEVWLVAVKLGMVSEDTNYFRINEYYSKWGQVGIDRIVKEGLMSNPFVYQLINRDIFVDDSRFKESMASYEPE